MGALVTLLHDVRHTLRRMLRAPTLPLLSASALAIGIGAVVTVFTLINAVILRPLPVRAPDELVWLRSPSFSYPIYRELRVRASMFAGLFAWNVQALNVRWNDDGGPLSTQALVVTGDFHSTLGVRPVLGRGLDATDEGMRAEDARAVAVLSHGAWRNRFGSDPGVIGRTVDIENVPVTIVGVTPPEFFGVAVGRAPEVTVPVTLLPRLRPDEREILTQSGRAWLHIMARLQPGLAREQGDAAFQTMWPRVLEATVDRELQADRQERYLSRRTGLEPGATGFSSVRNQFREPLWLLMGFVGLLLLVACATVANLGLVQATVRERELAIRLAIGASRLCIARQLLLEALMLSAGGALLGLLLSTWATDVLTGLLSTSAEPIGLATPIDLRVIAFTAVMACTTALLFGTGPAIKLSQLDPGPTLKMTARQHVGLRGYAGRLLVAVQIALSLSLVVGAGLFTRSLTHVLAVDPGFERRDLVLVSIDALSSRAAAAVAPDRAPGDRAASLGAYYAQLLERLGALPGVRTASLSWVPPISDGSWTQSIGIDGAPPADGEMETFFNAISPGYFETVGTPLRRGRDVRWSDDNRAPRVVIVNESLARAFFGTEGPIGRTISIGRAESRQNMEIVGVVADAKYQLLQEPPRPIAYLPYLQLAEFLEGNNLVAELRTSIPAARLLEPVRREVTAFDPTVPVHVETIADRIRESLVRERFTALLSSFLGAFSAFLAFGALYGLMTHLIARRTHELGLRAALGADERRVLTLIMRETLLLAGGGIAAGLVLSWALSRVAAGLLRGIGPLDLVTFIAATGLMLAFAMIAGLVPARRAARVDPAITLRSE